MRKGITLLLLSGLAVCVLAGCGKSKTDIEATENIGTEVDTEKIVEPTEDTEVETEPETETETEESTEVQYTYTDMDATKYAQSKVNVRDLPSAEGNKLGSLALNDEVKITGQCNETGWYRIEFNGETGYVSNEYIGDNQVEVNTPSDTSPSDSDTQQSAENPYPLYQIIDEGGSNVYFYCLFDGVNHPGQRDGYWDAFNACVAILTERMNAAGYRVDYQGGNSADTPYYVDGMLVRKMMPIVGQNNDDGTFSNSQQVLN